MFLVFRTKVIRGALTHWEWERTGGIRRCINIWNELLYLCSVIEKETHISVSTRCQGSKICVCDKDILPPSAFLGPWQWRLGWWEWRLGMLDWRNKKSREEVHHITCERPRVWDGELWSRLRGRSRALAWEAGVLGRDRDERLGHLPSIMGLWGLNMGKEFLRLFSITSCNNNYHSKHFLD